MPDIQTLQESLAKKQAELATLQRELEAARQAQFSELPAKVGLGSVDALIKALADFASPRLIGALKGVFAEKPVKAAPRSGAKAEAPAKAGKRKRARITPELKDQIVKALKAADKTVSAVAAEFGVSGATVNNIKKEAGLTRNKGKK
ncbi:MAG: transposase family protein [Verrucomicrobia bacterium]|nr:transposase family protein [Verrucomicrobiota bacterium]